MNPYKKYLRATAPFLIGVFLVILSSLPYRVALASDLMPELGIITVFYWSVFYRPFMPPGAAFFLGLIQDFVSGAPLGMNALLLLCVHLFSVSQRRLFVGKPFIVGWIGFAFTAVGAFALIWLIGSLFYSQVMPVFAMAPRLITTILIYPPLAWLFAWLRTRYIEVRAYP